MSFVFEGLFGVALVVGIVLSILYALTSRRERETKQNAQNKQEEKRRLYTVGEPLRCLPCGIVFPGPLPEMGCPQCHLSSLVVPEVTYRRTQGEG